MPGILANSTSVTMLVSATTSTGYITAEEITLTLDVTGSSYSWSLAKPRASTTRCALSDTTGASVTLVPDVEGYYVVTVLVSGTTTYSIRFSAVDPGVVTFDGARRWVGRTAASVPTPNHVGDKTEFLDSVTGRKKLKDSSGNVIGISTSVLTRDRLGTLLTERDEVQELGYVRDDTVNGRTVHDPGHVDVRVYLRAAGIDPANWATADCSAPLLLADADAVAAGIPLRIVGDINVGTTPLTLNATVDLVSGRGRFVGTGQITHAGPVLVADQPSWSVPTVLPVTPSHLTPENFGAKGDGVTDDNTALVRMRNAVRGIAKGVTIFAAPGKIYTYSRPYWLKGIKRVHLVAHGATFMNLVSAPTAYDNDSSCQLTNAYMQTTMGDADTQVGQGFTAGVLIATAAAGATSLFTQTPGDAAAFTAGARILVQGLGRNTGSFPLNPLRFEYMTVATNGNGGTGEIQLTEPLKHAYDSRWWDFSTSVLPYGAPRAMLLDRADYTWGESLWIEGGRFIRNAAHDGDFVGTKTNGLLAVYGFRHARLAHVFADSCALGDCQTIEMAQCQLEDLEIDKQLEHVTLDRCDIGIFEEGTGCGFVEIIGGRVRKQINPLGCLSSRWAQVDLRNNLPATVVGSVVNVTTNFAIDTLRIEDTTLAPIASSRTTASGLISGGFYYTLTVTSVPDNATIVVAAADDAAASLIHQRLLPGFMLREQTSEKYFVLKNWYQYDATHVALEGEVRGGAPVPGDVYGTGTIRLLDVRNVKSLDLTGERRLFANANALRIIQPSSVPSERDALVLTERNMHQPASGDPVELERYRVDARIREIEIDVKVAYSGASSICMLGLADYNGSSDTDFLRVDLKVIGRRRITTVVSENLQATDVLVTDLGDSLRRQISARVTTTVASAYPVYADASELPVFTCRLRLEKDVA